MLKRTAFVILSSLALILLVSSFSIAQVTPYPEPDEGVRGWGAIPLNVNSAVGQFDINVWRSGNVLFGGFKYAEIGTSTVRRNVIYSTRITSLVISGNFATVKALGYWNNMPSVITIEALDDNPSGDWFHIVAQPQSPLPIIYDQAGGLIKGDIVVYGRPIPDCWAKGDGTIAVTTSGNLPNVGRFNFQAERYGDIVKGRLSYMEYNPAGYSVRPRVSIYVPELAKLDVQGLNGYMAGKGTLNGIPAIVEVKVIDWSPTYRMPDEFYISATPLADVANVPPYYAGGPLTSGALTVGSRK